MTLIAHASPSTPTLPFGLMPIAANPVAAVDPSGADDGFESIIAGLDPGLMLDAPPMPMPTPGTGLPPERPDFAAPLPLPMVEVENVMVGSASNLPGCVSPPVSDGNVTRPLTVPPIFAEPSKPLVPPMSVWTLQTVSPVALAQATPRPLSFEIRQLPAEIPVEEEEKSGATPVADVTALPLDTKPEGVLIEAAPAEAKAPVVGAPTEPVLLPIGWVQSAPAATADQPPIASAAVIAPLVADRLAAGLYPLPSGTSPLTVTNPAKAGPEGPLPPVAIEGAESAPRAPAQPVAQVSPPTFALPPEIARQVAQLVQAVAGPNRDSPEAAPEPSATFTTAAPIGQPQPVFTAAPQIAGPVQLGFVDTIRAEWMQAMIDRIGEFAQADGKREAQIRLSPDVLGAIDVKIVERQDRLHVTLITDNAQTRQLLSDAAPRLHELAEARGLKLGQTGVGGGEAQDRRPAPEHPQTPLRPRSVSTARDQTETAGDLIA